jgi:hypothetical protein
MSIQKKSLISALKTTKKANVASIPTEGISGEKQTSMKVGVTKNFKNLGGTSVSSMRGLKNSSMRGLKASSMKSFKGVKASNMKSFKSLRNAD